MNRNEILHTSNELCAFCGRYTHLLAVPVGLTGQHAAVCISEPTTEHPTPLGAAEYTNEDGQRCFVVAVRQPDEFVDDVGRWLYESPSGWPLDEDELPAHVRKAARKAARRLEELDAQARQNGHANFAARWAAEVAFAAEQGVQIRVVSNHALLKA